MLGKQDTFCLHGVFMKIIGLSLPMKQVRFKFESNVLVAAEDM